MCEAVYQRVVALIQHVVATTEGRMPNDIGGLNEKYKVPKGCIEKIVELAKRREIFLCQAPPDATANWTIGTLAAFLSACQN